MNTVVIVIARMGSTRLPGKVLSDLAGHPVLWWVTRAAGMATLVDDVIVATTVEPQDDAIWTWCNDNHVKCFRGSEDDVLDRFMKTAMAAHADVAIRVTADCPFIDPNVIDQVVALREATGVDYVSNIDPPTWPDGLDCEAITMRALRLANVSAVSKIDRECVTTWTQRNRWFLECETLICPLPGMHKERWVLDTEDDYELCRAIAEGAYDYGWLGIKMFLDKHPDLRELNAHHPRNERYFAAITDEPLPPRSYEKSKAMLEKAERTIPLGAQTFSKSKIQYPSESPLFVSHADGGYCFDVDGNRYVDLVGGLLPVILGHRDPDVDYAIRRQLNNGISFSLATELEAELSELLCRLIPCAEWTRFGKNGSDVTSAAIRLARAHTGRSTIISSGYHGWHDWAVAWDEVRNKGVDPYVGRAVLPLAHGASSILRTYSGVKPAAVIVEPETNVEFLQECRRFCDDMGALLIFDEIITGFRFDLGGAQKLYGVLPDLACFGKSMANGMPISALVGKREYMKTMEQISYSGTFFGETLSIAAAIATIKKLETENVLPGILNRQRELSLNFVRIVSGDIKKSRDQHPVTLTGEAHLSRLKFMNNDVKTLFIQEMAQQGVLIIASHNLSYAHGDNEIKRVVTAYQHVLPMLGEAIETNTVKDRIKGRSIPAHANVRATSW